ncbi:MAG: hypothetical protein ABR509_04440 [Candidatus Limnocylindria bacterium]
MFDWLLDPVPLGILGVTALLSVLIGRWRGDPPLIVGASTIGYLFVLIGLWWSGTIGDEASYATAAAGFGAILMTMAAERARHRREVARGATQT